MADPKEKVMVSMVKIMENAGLRAVKIANIVRTNSDFKTELLPERKPVAQKMTMDGAEKIEKQQGEKCHRGGNPQKALTKGELDAGDGKHS